MFHLPDPLNVREGGLDGSSGDKIVLKHSVLNNQVFAVRRAWLFF